MAEASGSPAVSEGSAISSSAGAPPSVPPVTEAQPRQAVSRGAQACVECRKHKIRCHPGENGVAFPCKRCKGNGIACEVLKHNRGRKRKNPVDTDVEPAPRRPRASNGQVAGVFGGDGAPSDAAPSPNTRSALSVLQEAVAMHQGPVHASAPGSAHSISVSPLPPAIMGAQHQFHNFAPPPLPPPPHASTSTAVQPSPRGRAPSRAPLFEQREASTSASRPALDTLRFPFLTPRTERTGRKGIFTLTSLMRPEEVEELPPGISDPTQHSEYSYLAHDPVSVGIVTLEESRALFQLYMDEINPMHMLFDPSLHTHDYVRARSSFLFIAILSVISRFRNTTSHAPNGQVKRIISPIYAYCKQAAKVHLRAVLGESMCSLEVVQGLAVLVYHKQPEDEKACLHLDRAIAIAREIGLDQPGPRDRSALTDEERRWTRVRERVWLSLFVGNTIFAMQFDMHVKIASDDPLVSSAAKFAHGSHLPQDALLAASVSLRRIYHTYCEMAKSLDEGIHETTATADALSARSKAVSLSILTKTVNRELDMAAQAWVDECVKVGLSRFDHKVGLWTAAIKLKINLMIVSIVLPGLKNATSASAFVPPGSNASKEQRFELGNILAFHHALKAAVAVLQTMAVHQEKRLLSYATDTLQHFAIYSAFFLWTLCCGDSELLFDPSEADQIFILIDGTAKALESASLYHGDSPALHARFLRNLIRSRPDKSTSQPPQAGALQTPLDGPDAAYRFPVPTPPDPSLDAMLTADLDSMRMQFPWAFNDFNSLFFDPGVPLDTVLPP